MPIVLLLFSWLLGLLGGGQDAPVASCRSYLNEHGEVPPACERLLSPVEIQAIQARHAVSRVWWSPEDRLAALDRLHTAARPQVPPHRDGPLIERPVSRPTSAPVGAPSALPALSERQPPASHNEPVPLADTSRAERPIPSTIGSVATRGSRLMLRAQPTQTSRIVQRIPNGARLIILQRQVRPGWHRVRWGATTGYVAAAYIR